MTGSLEADDHAIRTAAVLARPAHDLVWVEGDDAVTFLEGLLSQRVESAPIGSVRRSLLLSPQGKLVSPLWILRGAGRIGLVADAGSGQAVVDTLERFRIRVDAAVEQEPTSPCEVWGPAAADVVSAATGIEPSGGAWTHDGGTMTAHLPFRHTDLPRWLIVGIEPSALVAAGAVEVDEEAVAAVRIEAGEPRMGVDVHPSTIPQEADLVADAVDFSKGCYLGQELVARIESRGHVNRHLRGLCGAQDVVPPVGAALLVEGQEVGLLTSVARSSRLGGPVGLGLVRREVAPGATVALRWDGGAAAAVVAELPLVAVGNG